MASKGKDYMVADPGWPNKSLPVNCPLPKWPSATREQIEKYAKQLLPVNYESYGSGNSRDTGGRIYIRKTSQDIFVNMLKSIGVEVIND
jgi:hypothetical protein